MVDMADEHNALEHRIFIAGVGEAVSAQDIENTFCRFGRIDGVELVRSNGRNFGYFNLRSLSGKSLTQILSLYNGCRWKGGRLRLEKAKEHYISRLSREWAEDAAETDTNNPDPDTTSAKLDFAREKLTIASDKSGLHMFIPRLRKVKLISRKGTGKHKYSFQRVECLPLNELQICNCEEHSAYDNAKSISDEHDFSDPYKGISERERAMMDVVMQRLFAADEEPNSISKQSTAEYSFLHANMHHNNVKIDMDKFNDLHDDKESSIIQVAAKSIDVHNDTTIKNRMNKGQANLEATEDLLGIKGQAMPCSGTSNRVSHIISIDTTDLNNKNAFGSEERLKPVLKSDENTLNKIRTNWSNDVRQHLKDPKGMPTCTKLGRQVNSTLWLQKDSWKNMVGQTGKASFSLSNITGAALPRNVPKENNTDTEAVKSVTSIENRTMKKRNSVSLSSLNIGSTQEVETKKRDKKKRNEAAGLSQSITSAVGRNHHEIRNLACCDGCVNKQDKRLLENNSTKFGKCSSEMQCNVDLKNHEDVSLSQFKGYGQIWVQKSPWKNLVAEDDETKASFLLSNVIRPEPDLPRPLVVKDDLDAAANTKLTVVDALEGGRQEEVSKLTLKMNTTDNLQSTVNVVNASLLQEDDKERTPDDSLQLPEKASESSEMCIFMRSNTAVNEWWKYRGLARNHAKLYRKSALRTKKILEV